MAREYVSKRGDAGRQAFVVFVLIAAAEDPRRGLMGGQLSVEVCSRVRARHGSRQVVVGFDS
jgi:hypothetical protein